MTTGTNKVTITNVVPGTVNIGGTITSAYTFSSFPSGWVRPGIMLFTGTCYLLLGYSGSASYTTIYRCTDLLNFATWTPITVPSGSWSQGAVSSSTGTIVLAGTVVPGPNTTTCYSTDDGLTWNTGSTFTSSQVYSMSYGNKFIIGFSSLSTGKQSTDGITWSNISLLTFFTAARPIYSPTMDLWFTRDPSGNFWRSTDGTGTSWTDISTIAKTGLYGYIDGALINEAGHLIYQLRMGVSPYLFKTFISSDGYNFNLIYTSISSSNYLWFPHSTYANVAGNNTLFNSSDASRYFFIRNDTLYRDSTSNGTGNASIRLPENFGTSPHPIAHTTVLPMIDTVGSTVYKLSFNLENAQSSSKYVDVTATKDSMTFTKRLPISLINSDSSIYALQVNPKELFLSGSLNGIVDPSSYTNAKSELTVLKNGIPQTGWTVTASDASGATANTVTGNIIQITAMSQGSSKSSVDIVVTHPTQLDAPTLLSTLIVNKGISGEWAGLASSFTKFSTNTNTYIAIKFLSTGYFQIKYGSGGSYTNAGMWYTPIDPTGAKGASYYMIVNYTGATVTTGSGGVLGGGSWTTWNRMNTSREYILSDATTGTHTANLEVALATSNTGANAIIGTGGLELIVP